MFKPNYNICNGCNKQRIIVVKKGLCAQCNNKEKNICRPVPQKRAKKIQYRRKRTGEIEVFKEIWQERPHICQVTKTPIQEFDIRCFSHVIPKSICSKLRLDKRNIWLVQTDIHFQWEFGDRNVQFFDEKRKLYELLRKECD